MGVEAAVGAHGELPAGPAVAHPAHRLTQEVGGAASGVGAALAQPGHQHLAGASGHGQQRVIAPLAGVAMASPAAPAGVGAVRYRTEHLCSRMVKAINMLVNPPQTGGTGTPRRKRLPATFIPYTSAVSGVIEAIPPRRKRLGGLDADPLLEGRRHGSGPAP